MEAQGRFLERIREEHQNRKPSKVAFSPPSLPSLCEESESNARDIQYESDFEAHRNEMVAQSDHYQEGFRAPKRRRVDDKEEEEEEDEIHVLWPRNVLRVFPTLPNSELSNYYTDQSMVFSEDMADDGDHIAYNIPHHELYDGFIGFSWNDSVAAACSSPLVPSFYNI